MTEVLTLPVTGSTGSARVPDLLPVRPCAVAASGTSRFVVLGGHDLPDEAAREAVVLDLMRGRGTSMGLGDSHYQGNKVVMVEDLVPGGDLNFRYYQVSSDFSRVYSHMECSNAAPVAALWARLHGAAAHRLGGVVNLSTGQVVELEPPETSWWHGEWGVGFAQLGDLTTRLTSGAQAFCLDDGSLRVAGHVVRHGNVFVLAEVAPGRLTSRLVERLAAVGDAYQARTGTPPGITKVVAYQRRAPLDQTPLDQTLVCEAACYSSGQRHHSLPGSAAMTLSAFLTVHGHVLLDPASPALGRVRIRLEHPSGAMSVAVDVRGAGQQPRVVATSFHTPVRLLLCGTAVA